MRHLIVLACTTFLSFTALAADGAPEETLESYLNILTGQDLSGIGSLMDRESMENLKRSMDESIQHQANFGEYGLQRRIFGKKVSMKQVRETAPEVYLTALASEILQAARSQHLTVTDRQILGKIQENEDTVHLVVRLNMSQDDTDGSEILVYTLVRENGGWKLKFPATIKQMLTVIEGTARQRH